MSVSPRDLLREAREIAGAHPDELKRRTAAGRAYYAAFHGAREFHNKLPSPGRSKAGVGEHENLIHQLRNPTVTDQAKADLSRTVGGLLLKLRPFRMLADYDLASEFAKREMNDAIELAAQLLNVTHPKSKQPPADSSQKPP